MNTASYAENWGVKLHFWKKSLLACFMLVFISDGISAGCPGYSSIEDISTKSITPVYRIEKAVLYTEGLQFDLKNTSKYFENGSIKYNEKTEGKNERFGYVKLAYSPDNKHCILSVRIGQGGPMDVWLIDYVLKIKIRLNFDVDNHTSIVWLSNSLFDIQYAGMGYEIDNLAYINDPLKTYVIQYLLYFDPGSNIYVASDGDAEKPGIKTGNLLTDKTEIFKLKGYKRSSYSGAFIDGRVKIEKNNVFICAENANGKEKIYKFRTKMKGL